MAWKQSKKDKKNAAKAAKWESPWEELQPSTEFFQKKDALGVAAAAGPLPWNRSSGGLPRSNRACAAGLDLFVQQI